MFDWDQEDEDKQPLIEDNDVEIEETPFPNIPAEMPGVELEEHLTSTLTESESEGDNQVERAEVATVNANFGPREAAILGGIIPAGGANQEKTKGEAMKSCSTSTSCQQKQEK